MVRFKCGASNQPVAAGPEKWPRSRGARARRGRWPARQLKELPTSVAARNVCRRSPGRNPGGSGLAWETSTWAKTGRTRVNGDRCRPQLLPGRRPGRAGDCARASGQSAASGTDNGKSGSNSNIACVLRKSYGLLCRPPIEPTGLPSERKRGEVSPRPDTAPVLQPTLIAWRSPIGKTNVAPTREFDSRLAGGYVSTTDACPRDTTWHRRPPRLSMTVNS